jgi:hypothetical protein
MPAADIEAAVAASAEGYAFPTNLERDPPIGGLAPQSQQELMRSALAQGHTPEAFIHLADPGANPLELMLWLHPSCLAPSRFAVRAPWPFCAAPSPD